MTEIIRREPVAHERFIPIRDQVVIKGERLERHIIRPDTAEDEMAYKQIEVVAYGDKTEYVNVGDIVKLSEFSRSLAPEILWRDEIEDEDGTKTKIDYLLVSEVFIKGIWIPWEEEDDDE